MPLGSVKIHVRISPPVFFWSRFLCLQSHVQASLAVSSSRERFVIWISGLELFTVEYSQASLHFLLSLICYWQSGGLKPLAPNGSLFFFFFFLLCSPFPLLQTHGHLAYAVYSLCRDCQLANKARVDTHGQSSHDGCQLSQTTGHLVKHSDEMVSLTELTIGTVDPVTYGQKRIVVHKFLFNASHCWKTIP